MTSSTTRLLAVRWGLLLGWAALIFLLSAQGHLELSADPTLDWILRKSAHLVVYAILAALTVLALSSVAVRRATLAALIIVALYALSDEFHQSFVAGRSPQATDVLIDIIGATIGLLLLARWQGRHLGRER
jgi:VanZ family protein